MIWLLFIFIGLVNGRQNTCYETPFCANMRHQKVSDDAKFTADISLTQILSDTANIPLHNNNGVQLLLRIMICEGNILRVKITEENSERYELKDVLVEEPLLIPFDPISLGKDVVTLRSSDPNSTFHIEVHQGPPFFINFFTSSKGLDIVLKGERLVMENSGSSQAFSFDLDFKSASNFYGLFHHLVNLRLSDTTNSTNPFSIRNSGSNPWNIGNTLGMYGNVPALIGHSVEKSTGIFLHNAAEQWVDISYPTKNSSSAYFMVEGGVLDLFVLLGDTTKKVVRQLTSLTGKAHLPQLWVLGYHQCRYTYLSQEDVKEVVAKMDQHDFPMDTIWLDIDYTDGKRYFTFDPVTFGDPVEMQNNVSSTNRKMVLIIDPHYKIDDNYPVYAGAKGQYFMKWANGSDFVGECWPGAASYIDFLNPEARDYYASWFAYDKFNGTTPVVAGIWNDMNEPSIFNIDQDTFPFELLHHGNVVHRDVHNMYGFLQTKATHQGLMQRDNGTKRPFILSRSHFAGSQRYAAMWTGDNTPDWPYLRITYPECMTANLMGHVLCGADVGGFGGNANFELFQRWYQAAIWLPFFRGHSNNDTARKEPYLYPEDVQAVIRQAMKLRYKHIPYFYKLFFEHVLYGDPIVKPLFVDYPTIADKDQYILVGDDLLATPVMEAGATSMTIEFPGSEDLFWYRADDNSFQVYQGGSSIDIPIDISISPYFYKSGSVITRRDIERKSTDDMRLDPFSVYANLDKSGFAEGTFYVDDYTSFDYQKQHYCYVTFTVYANRTMFISIVGSPGMFPIIIENIHIHSIDENGSEESTYRHTVDGTPLNSLDISKLAQSGTIDLQLI